jgi:hypothetical protein
MKNWKLAHLHFNELEEFGDIPKQTHLTLAYFAQTELVLILTRFMIARSGLSQELSA